MKTFIKVCILCILGILLGNIFIPSKTVNAAEVQKKFILDVDMETDTDDLWAVRAAEKLDEKKEEKLLAVMMSVSNGENALASLLTYDGYGHIPVGICSMEIPDESPYWAYLESVGPAINEQMDAVKLYRKILSESETRVSIVTTGYLHNIKSLLESEPDEYSELSGKDLIRKKVRAIHITGGNVENHWDNNFGYNQEAIVSSKYVFANWPEEIPVVVYTNDLGAPITIGDTVSESDPIYTCQHLASGRENGGPAWDVFNVWAFNCMDHNNLKSSHLSLCHCTIKIYEDGSDDIVDVEESRWWRITKTVAENNWYKQQILNLLEGV